MRAMKDRIGFILLLILGIALASGEAWAQQDSSGGKNNAGPYEVKSSIEIGVRGISIDGNADKYRSDLNYQPGFQVFNSSLLMRSDESNGMPFDSLLVNSFGWGGDPNQYLRVNAEKTRWYRFDATYRELDYFNSLRNFALNQHISDTEYRLGDFDLKLLPQNRVIRFNVGYSIERTAGPAISTYDFSRDDFPIIAPVRTEANEYRGGFEANLGPIDISFLQGYRVFKDDSSYDIELPAPGNNPTNATLINSFHRELPVRGQIPYTRFSIHSFVKDRLDITGRFIYSSAKTNFSLFETVTGQDFQGNTIVLEQSSAVGNSKRPNAIGDVGMTVLATDKLRISNTFRFNNFHITGGHLLDELVLLSRGGNPLPPLMTDTLSHRLTKYRQYMNTIEADYDFDRRFSVHAGYRYTDRDIELRVLDQEVGSPAPPHEPEEFDNTTHTLIMGFKARPVSEWRVYFDLEHGEADNVFTRVGNYDFTGVRLRSTVNPTRTLTFNGTLVTRDNSNPAVAVEDAPGAFGVDSDSRIFTGSADWAPNSKFFLSGGYTHMRVTSDASIILFVNSARRLGRSQYFLRDNFAFLNTYIELHPRARLYASYRFHKDEGQGDRVTTDPTLLLSSFPLQFQSPETRLSVRLHDNVDWVAGYQFYDYKEKFPNLQHYQAHMPYTSLRIYFGRSRE